MPSKTTLGLILWAHPRSLSTAVEIHFRTRGDFHVVHEPFADSYWYDHEPAKIRSRLLDIDGGPPLFVKEIAHHVPAEIRLDASFLTRFRHLVLVRSPLAAFSSHLRVNTDVKPHEFGYEALYEVFQAARKATGERPPVLQAEALQSDPEAAMSALCREVGIDYRPEAMRWSPEMHPAWRAGSIWQQRAAESRGFERPSSEAPKPVPQKWAAIFERHEKAYRRLLREAGVPS